MNRALLSLVAVLCWAGVGHAADPPPKPPDPEVHLLLERQELRAGETSRGEAWLVNPHDSAFTEAVLHIAAPKFLELLPESCEGKPFAQNISFGDLNPQSSQVWRFCLKARGEVREGDLRISFYLRSVRNPADGRRSQSFVTGEVPLKVGLFGSAEVGGISLSLIGLFLPGLFFWFALDRLGRAKALEGMQLIALSVVASALIQWLLAFLLPQSRDGLTSPGELLMACLTGIAIAVLWAAGVGAVSTFKKQRRDHWTLAPDDKPAAALRKLLKANPGLKKPSAIVRKKDGTSLTGSLAGRLDGGALIVGALGIDRSRASAELSEQISESYSKEDFLAAVSLAEEAGLPFITRQAVEKKDGSAGEPVSTGKAVVFIPARELEPGDSVKTAEGGEWAPVSL